MTVGIEACSKGDIFGRTSLCSLEILKLGTREKKIRVFAGHKRWGMKQNLQIHGIMLAPNVICEYHCITDVSATDFIQKQKL